MKINIKLDFQFSFTDCLVLDCRIAPVIQKIKIQSLPTDCLDQICKILVQSYYSYCYCEKLTSIKWKFEFFYLIFPLILSFLYNIQ